MRTRISSFYGRLLMMLAVSTLVTPLLNAQRVPVENPEAEISRHQQEYEASRARPQEKGFEEDVRGRQEWFYFQRRFPFDHVPSGARAAAIDEVKAMERRVEQARANNGKGSSLLAASSWEEIGPFNIVGRIMAIAQHPVIPGTIYIGAASGGVWKTTDNGANWTTGFDKQTAIAVGALAIDYSNPDIIFAGTGENVPHSEEYFSDGIFKSTDGGATWRNKGLRNVGGFSKIFVHRQNSSIVYALGDKEAGGFYRSTDAGENWVLIRSIYGYDMTVVEKNSDIILITSDRVVLRSTDGGLHWSDATSGINVSGGRRISVSFAQSDPTRAYALTASDAGSQYHRADFYASTNGGVSWTHKHEFEGDFFRAQGYYNNCLAVHPDSSEIVLAGGIDVFRTDDGGEMFINYTQSYVDLNNPDAVHPDQHVLEFAPLNHNAVLLGNDGGLYSSPNSGKNWREQGQSLPITQFYKMDVDQVVPGRVYGGTQDNGSVGSFNTGADAKQWRSISGGDGFFVAVDPISSNIVYSEVYYGQSIYRTNTNDMSWVDVADGIEAIGGEAGDWSSPLVISPADGRLYSGRVRLYRSGDAGGSWERLRPGSSGFLSAVGLSFVNGGHIVTGTNTGDIRYTVDDGATWKKATGTPVRTCSDLRYDPIVENRVYATFSGFGSGKVFRSDDYGATFTSISSNLPNVPVNTIAIDPFDNSHLFIGTDAGAFVSLDGGALWLPFNDGLPFAPVVDLKMQYSTRSLVAATHGRSMFKINVENPVPQPLLIDPVGGESFASPGEITSSWAGLNGPLRVGISYDGGNTFRTVAEGHTGSSISIAVPLVKTTEAVVRVEEMEGPKRVLESQFFSLLPNTNGASLSKRGFIAEAIEIRRNYLWTTVRGSDSIYKMKLPLLVGAQGFLRTGIPGVVRDMAYDPASDRFYLLVAEDDFSNAKLYRMDTAGVGEGEIPLPEGSIAGVAVVPGGIALITPGTQGKLYLIDTTGRVISQSGPLQGGEVGVRRGLVWDNWGIVQGVTRSDDSLWFPSSLERARLEDPLRVLQQTPSVINNIDRLSFFGLAYDSTGYYWATDTSGVFYKFTQSKVFAGINDDVVHANGHNGARARSLSLTSVSPNPFRGQTEVRFSLRSGGAIRLELYRPNGERVAGLIDGAFSAGEHSFVWEGGGLASGIYYLVLSADDGSRDILPAVVVQ